MCTDRASCTRGVLVNTFEPGMAGMALDCHGQQHSRLVKKHAYHEATGLGDRSTSTRHILQSTVQYQQYLWRLNHTALPTVPSDSKPM